MRQVLCPGDPQCVVIRISDAVDLIDGSVGASRMGRLALCRQNRAGQRHRQIRPCRCVKTVGHKGLVAVLNQLQVRPLRSHVSHFEPQARRELFLHRQVPVLRTCR